MRQCREGLGGEHIYQRTKKDCFVMCQLLVPGFQGFFSFLFDLAINRTNEANKEGSTHYYAVYILRCLWWREKKKFLDTNLDEAMLFLK